MKMKLKTFVLSKYTLLISLYYTLTSQNVMITRVQ